MLINTSKFIKDIYFFFFYSKALFLLQLSHSCITRANYFKNISARKQYITRFFLCVPIELLQDSFSNQVESISNNLRNSCVHLHSVYFISADEWESLVGA